MVEKDTVFKGKVKNSGIFSFTEIYEFLYDWLNTENYRVKEKKYAEKILGETKNVDISWECDKKVSDYFKYQIKLDWMIIGLKKVEVKKGDQTVNMNSGSIEIKFSAVLIKDYESKWENHPLWKFLRGVYDRYIIRTRIQEYGDKLDGEVNELIDQCKAFLALEGRK